MTAIYFEDYQQREISRGDFDRLRQLADASPLKRARYCLHRNESDPVHEMIIALRRDTYVHPHRHHDKCESFHVIEGEMLVVFFDDQGRVVRKFKMAPAGTGLPFYQRLNCAWWHSVVPLTEYVIMHETAAGPFDPAAADRAVWAPDGSDPAAVAGFLRKIQG